eukprot:CAMPEP_0115261262 /NCGR_PEP_ID=MMETSP0270-20121206/48770_1 /TAXON_ID=71861 /ORGANISM="Scrippsiella trochoidea, Strain CCMP3099" /LENGTH=339 /DNA_ID=CAMNT_0002677139 /DNA_START=62 /DNA_END=1081 /DNA_ORIENTATION=+
MGCAGTKASGDAFEHVEKAAGHDVRTATNSKVHRHAATPRLSGARGGSKTLLTSSSSGRLAKHVSADRLSAICEEGEVLSSREHTVNAGKQSAEEDSKLFKVGSKVELCGLEASASYNGQTVEVVLSDLARSCYVIRVGDGSIKTVLAENVRRVCCASQDASALEATEQTEKDRKVLSDFFSATSSPEEQVLCQQAVFLNEEPSISDHAGAHVMPIPSCNEKSPVVLERCVAALGLLPSVVLELAPTGTATQTTSVSDKLLIGVRMLGVILHGVECRQLGPCLGRMPLIDDNLGLPNAAQGSRLFEASALHVRHNSEVLQREMVLHGELVRDGSVGSVD